MGVHAQEGLRDRDRTFAASQKIASDLRRARFRWGSFYLLSSIQLSDIGYEQQFFEPTAEQGSGATFGVSAPQRLYFVPTRKSVYSAEVTPQYSVFNSGHSHQTGYTVRGDAQYLFNHLYLDVFAQRARTLQPYTGEIDRLSTLQSQNVGVAGEMKYSSRTSVTFQASASQLIHPRNGKDYQPTGIPIELLDRIEQTYRAALNHKTFPLTQLSLIAERSNYSFRYTSFKDAHRTFFGPGLNFDNGRTSFRTEVGAGRLHFVTPGQRDYSGVLGNVSFGRRGPVWNFSTVFVRDVEFSILNNTNFYVIDRAQLNLDYTATRKLLLRFGSNLGRDHYVVAAIAPNGMLIMRQDTLSFTWIGFLYQLRRLRAGVDVGYYTRDTNFADVEKRDGIRTVLHLSFTP
jgi:hypothetical protein